MQEDALDDLAASLASNRTSGTCSALPLSRIASPDAAHAVQAAALVAYDNDFIGYTLIGTSSASRRFLALEAPVFAPIANKSHYTEECRIRLPQGMIGAQCELALTIGAAYPQPGQPIDRVSAAEAIVVCQPAIGLVGRRAPPDIDPQLAAIADFGLHVATISGRQAEHVDPSELINATLAAKINDQPVFSCNVGDFHRPPARRAGLARRTIERPEEAIERWRHRHDRVLYANLSGAAGTASGGGI